MQHQITVKDSYGDTVLDQHLVTCRECGAVLLKAAHYPDGSAVDTTAVHAAWHARQPGNAAI